MSFLFLITLLMPRPIILKVVQMWVCLVAGLERYILGLTYQIEGWDNVPSGPCLIAAQHQSTWETFKLHLWFGNPAIVLKRELLLIPIWGWYLKRSGVIAIDRSGKTKSLLSLLKESHHALKEGRKIVIYPQGTRIPFGDRRPLKSGIAALYRELNVSVVPMVLNSGLYWPKGSYLKKSGIIRVVFLQAIPPGLTRENFMGRLERSWEEATESLGKPNDRVS